MTLFSLVVNHKLGSIMTKLSRLSCLFKAQAGR